MNGNLDVSDKEQMALYNQELANYNKQISNFDAEIAKLMKSNSVDALTQKQKLESEKALAQEKKKAAEANKARLAEIEKAKKEEAAAAAGRSAEQQKKILEVSKSVNEKAAELRKLKTENLSALGKIKLLESKKAALIEIRNNVKKEQKAIPAKYKKEYDAKIAAVNKAPWRTYEKNEDGTPAKEAIEERKQKVKALEEERDSLCLAEQKKIAEATYDNQVAIMADILIDQEQLPENTFYANTLNKNLRVKVGNYSRSNDGWKVNYTILCDGIEIGASEGFIKYDALESFIPSGMNKFDAVDMYDSLFKCGEPILTFEVLYEVKEYTDKILTYGFSFSELKMFDTNSVTVNDFGVLHGYSITTASHKFEKVRVLKPVNDRKEDNLKAKVDNLFQMVKIPGKNYKVGKTEVTQALYQAVMGENPSEFKGNNNPVERVSWFDAIVFCNKLSKLYGFTPVYSVNGTTDVKKWGYTPHKGESLKESVQQNTSANGYRLPTSEEWEYAAKGGQNYNKYAGSNYIEEVAWYNKNSGDKTHLVAQKKANGYGLYDISGNVWEWVWGIYPNGSYYRCGRGGSFYDNHSFCEVNRGSGFKASNQIDDLGFRIVRSSE